MKERISQLASGKVQIEVPELELLVPAIEETVAGGQNFRGDIRLGSGNGLPVRGLVYSDDSRVVLQQSSFAGTSVYISYEVRADQMDPGTELSGSFCLVTNGGERRIPYLFHVRETGGGRNDLPGRLEDFVRMAHEEPLEAGKLMDSRAFPRLPFMENPSLRALYDGLMRSRNREHLTEEFLVAAGAKERIKLSLPEGMETLHARGKRVLTLPVLRNTWGLLKVVVSSDADWLIPDKEVLTEADFREDRAEISLKVEVEKLHSGENCARIQLSTPFQKLPVLVFCQERQEDQQEKAVLPGKKKERLEFLKTLLATLAGKGDPQENLERMQLCWEEMTADREPSPRDKLYRAAISLWKEDRELSALILDDVERDVMDGRREDPDAYLAYLYLRMKVSDSWEQKEQLYKILKHYRENGQDSPFVFLLQLHVDESAADRPLGTLAVLESYYEKGCRSPFLYLEAIRIYNRHPDVLRELSDFSCAVLANAARRGYLTEEAAAYVASLMPQDKKNAERLLQILKQLYRVQPSDEVLSSICALLIRQDTADREDFFWFSKGVEKDIRLTRLYDYFLATAPRDQMNAFPREIVLYFSYNAPRKQESQKLLYGNLLRHYNRDRQIMDSYNRQMRDFVLSHASAGVIDAEMAPLYERMLELSDVNDRLAKVLPDLLNAMEIRCEGEEFDEVILVYGELEEEFSAPIKNGAAVLPVYTDSAKILVCSRDGTRYAGNGCTARRLMTYTKALEGRCMEMAPRHAMLRMKECRRILDSGKISETDLRSLKRELDARGIHRQFKRELVRAVADTAIHRPVPQEDEILGCAQLEGISREQRRELAELLVSLGRLADAERQVRRIGYRELPLESMQTLAALSIQNGLYTKDELLLDMCRTLLSRGKADDLILEYLCTYFNSASEEMVPVLETAAERGCQLSDMPERLLAQMLFTGSHDHLDQVFRIYAESPDPHSQLLMQAYYVLKCSDAFERDEKAGEGVYRFVEDNLSQGTARGKLPEICRLALLKHYARKKPLSDGEKERAELLLGEFLRQGTLFAWMKGLEGKIHLPEEILCREWVEFHGEKEQHLELRLRLLPEGKDRPPLQVVFPEVYPGIYVKPFLLFEGDRLEWEACEGGQMLERGTLEGRVSALSDHSRFAELNRLQALARSGARGQDFQEAVLDYSRKEAWVWKLFGLPE